MATEPLANGSSAFNDWWVVGGIFGTTLNTQSLNSAFSYGSSGAGIALPFISAASGTLTDIWVPVDSYNGTWGSTDGKIQVGLYNASSTARKPGTVIGTPEDLTLSAGTTGWYRKTLATPLSLTAYTQYCIVVGDSDGGATNFVKLGLNCGASSLLAINSNEWTTSNGFSTAGSSNGLSPLICYKVNGIVYGGMPVMNVATTASDSLPVGNAFTFDQMVDVIGVGLITDQNSVQGSTVKIFKSTTAPSGSPEVSWVVPSSALSFTDYLQYPVAAFTLQAGIKYYAVLAKGSALTVPRLASNPNGGMDSDLQKLFPLEGRCFGVKKDATLDQWNEAKSSGLITGIYGLFLKVKPSATAPSGGASPVIGGNSILPIQAV